MAMKKIFSIKVAAILLALIAIAGIISTYYFYNQYQKSLQNPSSSQAKQVQDLVSKIGRHMELPEGTPTIATVIDIQKLRTQSFFRHAKNGDKVLIYSQEKTAILYDPQEDKIVEVGPVNISSNSVTKKLNTVSKTSIAIYNGTSQPNAAQTVKQQITDKFSTLTVVATSNASKNTYEKTLVIDTTNTHAALAKQLANVFNGDVVNLPLGEIKPNADILLIIGKNTH